MAHTSDRFETMLQEMGKQSPALAQFKNVCDHMKEGQEAHATVCCWQLSQMLKWDDVVAQEFTLEVTNVVNQYQRKQFMIDNGRA